MLFDVTECCCDALRDLERADAERYALESTCDYRPLRDTYTLLISSPGIEQEERMRALFEESGVWPRNIVFIHDDGDSFDAHYNDAFDQVWALGYDTILSMGCDMPALRRSIIVEGFDLNSLPIGTRFVCNDVVLELTQIGKQCHAHCAIYHQMGDCIMPREGVFCKVIAGGTIAPGDLIEIA